VGTTNLQSRFPAAGLELIASAISKKLEALIYHLTDSSWLHLCKTVWIQSQRILLDSDP